MDLSCEALQLIPADPRLAVFHDALKPGSSELWMAATAAALECRYGSRAGVGADARASVFCANWWMRTIVVKYEIDASV